MRAFISSAWGPSRHLRTMVMLAALVGFTCIEESAAEPCQFGSNRPAIDTMARHLTPGATVIACDQKTVPMVRPGGEARPMKVWSFGVVKGGERR